MNTRQRREEEEEPQNSLSKHVKENLGETERFQIATVCFTCRLVTSLACATQHASTKAAGRQVHTKPIIDPQLGCLGDWLRKRVSDRTTPHA